jgi:N utilization substance protein A
MENINLIESFSEFKDIKNIDRATLMSILEDVFRSMIRKRWGSDENFDVIVNPERGDLEIWRNREIVDDEFAEDSFDYDENKHIALAEARKIEPDFEIGEQVTDRIKLDDFGRRAVLAIRQNLVSRVLDLEKDALYRKYKERVGDVITGEVYQVWKKETMVLDDEGNELILPKTEQIPGDFFKKGDAVRAVVFKVDLRNNRSLAISSRKAMPFARLFSKLICVITHR